MSGLHQIANLLEQMKVDVAQISATESLIKILETDSIELDAELGYESIEMVSSLLKNQNGAVRYRAVKCLGLLVNKVKVEENQVKTIVDLLCTNMVSNNEQLCNISSIGLKMFFSKLPKTPNLLPPIVCQNIAKNLCRVITEGDFSVQLKALNIISDFLACGESFKGEDFKEFSDIMYSALIPQLSSQRPSIRKCTIDALSHLVSKIDYKFTKKIMKNMLTDHENEVSSVLMLTKIQLCAAICRQAGHQLCSYIDRIMGMIVELIQKYDDELREACFQACEAFVQRCPKRISKHIDRIVDLSLNYITYDPNYNYQADDEAAGGSIVTEDDEDIDSEEYSEDDDMSWKVRRSAAKCLEAVITTLPNLVKEFYDSLSSKLIARFKEREENVKSDIFHAYIALLRISRQNCDMVNPDAMKQVLGSKLKSLPEQVPEIVQNIQPLMREKSMKTRQDCFSLLRELLNVLPGAFANNLNQLMPGIQHSLSDKNSTSNMKIDALRFLCNMLNSHDAVIFHPHIPILMQLVVALVTDPFVKIATEALLVLQHLVKVIRPVDHVSQLAPEFKSFVGQIYDCTLQKLKSQDVDQEVKERAIICMGQIISNLGDGLNAELAVCLPIFLEGLRNEVTRLSAVKALIMIAESPLRVNLTPILTETVELLGTFLQKNQRALKLNSLWLLDRLVNNYCQYIDLNSLRDAIAQVPPLISEADLHVAQQSLVLLTSTASYQSKALVDAYQLILPKVLNLLRSPLLQGTALNCMLELFQALVRAQLPNLGYRQLLDSLRSIVDVQNNQQLQKQAFHSIAKCVAALTLQVQNEAIPLANELLSDIKKQRSDAHIVFCLLTFGEIGRHSNLSEIKQLPQLIIQCFSSTSEEIKSAASHALGAVAVGNLNYCLPSILEEIKSQPQHKCLLLHSLKELISSLSQTENGLQQLNEQARSIQTALFEQTVDDGLDIRKAVFECMYTLIEQGLDLDRVDINQFLEHVQAGLKDHDDIKMLSYLMAPHLAKLCLNGELQRLKGALRTTFTADQVKQEYENQSELMRTALRVLSTLSVTVTVPRKNCPFPREEYSMDMNDSNPSTSQKSNSSFSQIIIHPKKRNYTLGELDQVLQKQRKNKKNIIPISTQSSTINKGSSCQKGCKQPHGRRWINKLIREIFWKKKNKQKKQREK